ncbi:hypothetical protein Pan44_47150 [Caulifigura coniformis]|uniref:Uncharacterized protein n=2 Tax=Caulifigura coniformis TaxID=2527983 RepID=A0A517SKL8_9PLAN|nr:hypothetical protein Pan44_47150 [Caulifigura coniformis]
MRDDLLAVVVVCLDHVNAIVQHQGKPPRLYIDDILTDPRTVANRIWRCDEAEFEMLLRKLTFTGDPQAFLSEG